MARFSACVLVLIMALTAKGDKPTRSSVRFMGTEEGRCSAVVLSPRRALTAWHCVEEHTGHTVDGVRVTGTRSGEDLAVLVPVGGARFDGPYAHPTQTAPPLDVLLEGFGCDARTGYAGMQTVHRSVRSGVLVGVTRTWPGMEIWIAGRVCPGDSGGALWADGGGLVGVITAASSDRGLLLAFATPVP